MTFGEHYGLVDIRAAVTLGTWRHKGSGDIRAVVILGLW